MLGFPADVTARIVDRVADNYGRNRVALVLNASHTHSAPVVGDNLRPAYPLSRAEIDRIEEYTSFVVDSVTFVVHEALTHLRPASLAF